MFVSARLVCKLLAVWGAPIYLAKMEEVGEQNGVTARSDALSLLLPLWGRVG